MRVESAGMVKGRSRAHGRIPRDGSRLRLLYDELQISRGLPIVLDFRNMGFRHCGEWGNAIVSLRDFYGLDIRLVGHNGIKNPGARSPHGPSTWILAGEWFGREYVDYIAPRVAEDRGDGQKS